MGWAQTAATAEEAVVELGSSASVRIPAEFDCVSHTHGQEPELVFSITV